MKKSTSVRSRQSLLSKRWFAALLTGMLTSPWAATGFAQNDESLKNTITTTGNLQVEQSAAGFQISADAVVLGESAELGKYWLGLGLKRVEGDLATYLGSSNGMLIFEIYPDSPAAKAEWKKGDILLSFNGKDVSDFETLLGAIHAVETKSAKCILLRRGEKIEAEITPEVRPETAPAIEADNKEAMTWTFEALPEEMQTSKDGKKTMILRAVPGFKLPEGNRKVFRVEGHELKLPEEALKAIPDLEGAMKALKNIEVTQIGEGVAVGVASNGTEDGKNISVSVIRKSDEESGQYTVVIDGEKFEGSMDKLKDAPEAVQKALQNVQVGTKAVTLQNGVTMTISPKVLGDKTQKEIEVILKKAEEASKKMEGTVTTTIVTDGKQSKDADVVKKNIQVVVKDADAPGQGTTKDETKNESTVTTKSRIVIASTDEKGEVKVIELDGDNIAGNLKLEGTPKLDGKQLLGGKLPKEVIAKIEEAKKKTEAAGKKSAAIALGQAKQAAEGKMQLRLQAVGSDKNEALKKEIEELRASINELKKQIEEMKK